MAANDEAPVAPPNVSKRIYNALKQYLGLSSAPQFTMSSLIQPTMEMSRLVDQGEIQTFAVGFNWGDADPSTCYPDYSVPVELPCPSGFEHIYIQLTLYSCAADAFKPRVSVGGTNPNYENFVYINDTASSRHFLTNSVLPIYVPQNSALRLYSDQATKRAGVSYLRIQRVFGLGPLVV